MKIDNKDFGLLCSVYESLGYDKFVRLCKLVNVYCIDELGICEYNKSKKTPLDNNNEDYCIKCIADNLKDLLE